MSATTWLIVAIVGFSISGIALVIAIFMFVKLNIPAVIGDLTGKTVAREIKAIREFNESKGDRRFRSSSVNIERGPLTNKVGVPEDYKKAMGVAHASKRLDKSVTEKTYKTKSSIIKKDTEGLNDFINPINNIVSEGSEPTETLSSKITEILVSSQTEVLDDITAKSLTTVLSNETSVLSDTEELVTNEEIAVPFKVTKSVVEIHTDEVL